MDDPNPTNERLTTGVPSFDRILGGGLLRGALALLFGAPGTGKTVLAQQLAFHHAAQGGTVLYLTGYSETHEKILRHTRAFRFFQSELIGTRVHLANLISLLQTGPEETVEAIVSTARSHRATLVIVDGFTGLSRLLHDEQTAAHFLYSLGGTLSILGVTTLIVTEGDPNDRTRYAESTICDVIVALRQEAQGHRERRTLQVFKARGSAPLPGRHPFVIDSAGLTLAPRLESVVGDIEPTWVEGHASLGSPSLDALLGGGPQVGTALLVIGSPGAGKTFLGLQFVMAGVRVHEPALIVSLTESPTYIRALAAGLGLDLAAAEATGDLRLISSLSDDVVPDALAQLIIEDVERRGVRRVMLDSVAELDRLIDSKERQTGFLASLVRYLRSRQITTYLALETPTIVGPELDLGDVTVSMIAESVLMLRSVEYLGRLHRVLSIFKMRFSHHDRGFHEYAIAAGPGFHLLGPAPRAEGLLTGLAHPISERPARDTAIPDADPL